MAQYNTRAQRPRTQAIPEATRQRIFRESAYTCVYCGWIADCIDHLIPYSYGGTDADYNLVAACSLCNHIAYNFLFDTVDEKRAYILAELPKHRRVQFAECADCGERFRQRWEGSTTVLCSFCNTADLAKAPHDQETREYVIWRENRRLRERHSPYAV